MATRLKHRAMYEKFINTNPVTPKLEEEVIAHLREVVKEGTTVGPALELTAITTQTIRGWARRDPNARRATQLISQFKSIQDDSQEWLDMLFEAIEDYLHFEKESADTAN